jgi:hypothetical protein
MKENMEIREDYSRLQFFPIMMYAIVMGLGGLTITYQKAHTWLGFSSILGTVLMYITTITFIVNAGDYLSVRIETSSRAAVEDISASFLLYPDNSIS